MALNAAFHYVNMYGIYKKSTTKKKPENGLSQISFSVLTFSHKGLFTNYVMPLRSVGGQQNITIANFIK